MPGPVLTVERNPFADRAVVNYEIARSGPVSCVVRDIAGREIARLYEGIQPAGRHSVAWSSAGAIPGVYFVELNTGGTTHAARLVKAR